MATQISRDPFARSTTMRRTMPPRADGCAWCGSLNRFGNLYQYGTEQDGLRSRVDWHAGLYCSKPCHDSCNS